MLNIYRKVQNESATGSSTSHRVRTTLTVTVETVDFDTQACLLRLKGRNIEENEYVKVSHFVFWPCYVLYFYFLFRWVPIIPLI